jgi:hypothetical protein
VAQKHGWPEPLVWSQALVNADDFDRLTLYLINKNVIKLNQFNPEGNGVRMDDKARNGYLRNYEKFMTASFIDARTRKRMHFRKIIKDRVGPDALSMSGKNQMTICWSA